MTIAHGPVVAIMLSFMPDDLLGVAFYPNAREYAADSNYTKGQKISMIDGLPIEDHEALGQPGTRGFAFEIESDRLDSLDVAFIAKPDANKWINCLQANGLNMIHEPGYEMVLAALRQICEPPLIPIERGHKR